MERQPSDTGKNRSLTAESIANSIEQLKQMPGLDHALKIALSIPEEIGVSAEEQKALEEALYCVQRAANLLKNLGPRFSKPAWLLEDLSSTLMLDAADEDLE